MSQENNDANVLRACPSCGAEGTGRYCAACGERFLTSEDFRFGHFVAHQLAHEMIHWDGKIGRTLRLLILKPGEYAARIVQGQRQPFLNPVRLYLVVFFVQAVISGLGTAPLTLSERAARYDPTGFTSQLAAKRRLDQRHPSQLERESSGAHWVGEAGTLLIAFLVGGVQMILLRRYRRHYIEHLTLSLTVITFSMLATVAASLLALAIGHGHIGDSAQAIRSNAVAAILPVYWFFAIKRFYGAPLGPSLLYAATITLAYFAIAFALNVGIIAMLIQAS
jgi:hypothetical protein